MECIIIDDEYRSREVLAVLLKTHCPDVTVKGMAHSVQSGEKLINLTLPQLVFLDIEMADGSGFDLLMRFEKPNFRTVFVTSYDHYAIQAVKFHAYDYLLKPVLVEELKTTISKLEKELQESGVSPADPHPILEVNHKTRLDYLKLEDITLLKGDGNYTYIYTVQGKTYHTSRLLREYETILCTQHSAFVRTHKSSIVNLRHVNDFQHGTAQGLLLCNGTLVEVSRRKKEEVLQTLRQFRSEKS